MYGLDFKRIPSFPDYAVSRGGWVIRLTPKGRGKLLKEVKPFVNKGGYVRITLAGKNVMVHRLVAETFLGPCPPGHEVNHKDGNKSNNCASNLEYVRRRENIKHAYRAGLMSNAGADHPQAKLTDDDVRAIRAAVGTCEQIGGRFGISLSNVWLIRKRRTWRHVA